MLGFIFPSFVFLASVLESSALERNFERCFLYPVIGTKRSPSINIEGNATLSVTINHIYEKPNVVRFFDQRNICVAALQFNTSDQVNCTSTLQPDNEFTTLFFRHQDGILTVRKTHSFEDELTLPGGIKKLQADSSEMVNVAFDCRFSDCYKFEKATIHKRYTDQKPFVSIFPIYGKIKSSADDWPIMIKVNDNMKLVNFTPSKFTKNMWHSMKFKVERKNGTAAKLSISDSEGQEDFKELISLEEDLYLSFIYPANVTWAINCKPGDDTDEACSSDNQTSNSVHEELWIVFSIIGGLTFFLLTLIGGLLVCRNHPPYVKCTSATDRRVFQVTVGEGPREKLSVTGDVGLKVEGGHMAIISREGNRIARWDVTHIRRFGYGDTRFYFEAGRKSAHGQGRFEFITTEGRRISEVLRQETESLLARLVTRTTTNPPQAPVQTLLTTDDGYEIPLTLAEHDYEEIPGIPTHYSGSHHSYISLTNGMEEDYT